MIADLGVSRVTPGMSGEKQVRWERHLISLFRPASPQRVLERGVDVTDPELQVNPWPCARAHLVQFASPVEKFRPDLRIIGENIVVIVGIRDDIAEYCPACSNGDGVGLSDCALGGIGRRH